MFTSDNIIFNDNNCSNNNDYEFRGTNPLTGDTVVFKVSPNSKLDYIINKFGDFLHEIGHRNFDYLEHHKFQEPEDIELTKAAEIFRNG